MTPQAETIQVGSGFRAIHLLGVFLGLGLLLAVILFLGDRERVERLLSSIEFLKVNEVEVNAEWPIVPSTVKTWLPPLEGRNIVLVEAGKLMDLLTKRPWVDSVSIKKEYPNRIRIQVYTKRPEVISLVKGQPYFLDPQGNPIEKVTPAIVKSLDLPFLVLEKENQQWNMSNFLTELEKIRAGLGPKVQVSQVVLGNFPYFKTYLLAPKVEVVWSFLNWETQLPNLQKLISSPPSQTGQLQRINLVFPKKAIVSSSVYH